MSRTQLVFQPLEPSRPEVAERPTVIALPVPSPYSDYGRITERQINESLPDSVGASSTG